MAVDHARMEKVSRGFATKSDKIRALGKQGYSRSEIAKYLDVRYQFVRNVLVATEKAGTEPVPKLVPADGIRNRARLKMEAGGRILIPAGFREAMEIEEGATILAWLERGELRLASPRTAIRRAQELADELIDTDRSLADELIADRRKEAKQEDEDG